MNEKEHRFSRRTSWDLSQGSFSAAIARERAAGRGLLDLTVSNPTRCGFDYDVASVLGAFTARVVRQRALVYDPDPRGMRSARESVALYYADHGAAVESDSIVLTTSTSEAYSYLFRLLCDAGDEVLVAQPSYPLFEFLADLDDVQLVPYPLFYDYGWWIDFGELESKIGPRTRAILVVHPNNPTGHWTHAAERERLEALCERHQLALIVDEVFLDYPLDSSASNFTQPTSFSGGTDRAMTFILSGVSKIAALPQMKAAWIITKGPKKTVAEALSRLEVIADTFLSMSAPTQLALPEWLRGRRQIQSQITARTRANLSILRASGMDTLQCEAGWSAVVRVRGKSRDQAVAEMLLVEAGVIVHPGEFYGLPEGRIVVSLLPPADVFRTAVDRVSSALADDRVSRY